MELHGIYPKYPFIKSSQLIAFFPSGLIKRAVIAGLSMGFCELSEESNGCVL